MPDIYLQGADTVIEQTTPTAQWLLQCRLSETAAISAQAGMTLGSALLSSTQTEGWHALHLGPDEWLLFADDGADEKLPGRIGAVDGAYSLVDVSNRNLGLTIKGAGAADLLASACPLDLERLADGACTRTLFGKATIVLWRRGDGWQIIYARSFQHYVMALLTELLTDLSAA